MACLSVLAKKVRVASKTAVCGTLGGYAKHRRNSEDYCDSCREAKRLSAKLDYAKNPEQVLARTRKWIAKNKDKRNVAARKRNAQIPKEIKSAKKRKYREQNLVRIREVARECERRRKAAKLRIISVKYTEQEVLLKYSDICYICNTQIDLNANRKPGQVGWEYGLHIDHLIPLSKNGSDTIDNVRPTHGLCNIRKHDKESYYGLAN